MVQFVVLIFNLHDLPLRTTQVDAVLNVQKDPDNNNRENSLQSDSTKKNNTFATDNDERAESSS